MAEEQSASGQELLASDFALRENSEKLVKYAQKIYYLLIGIVIFVAIVNVLFAGGAWIIHKQSLCVAEKQQNVWPQPDCE